MDEDIFAIDGHDGSGKTTLARSVAAECGASYQRPFHGSLGLALLKASERRDAQAVIAIGQDAIEKALLQAAGHRPIVLDRGWMTVASLVTWEKFLSKWRLWIPTALCWSDLLTTSHRLSMRSEEAESDSVHRHYLEVYQRLATTTGSTVIRTDLNSEDYCRTLLLRWMKTNPVAFNPTS